jgi:hypothetical protein
LLVGVTASPLAAGLAQGGTVKPAPGRQAARQALRAERQAQRAGQPPASPEVVALRRQVKQAFNKRVQQELNLNGEQMQSLLRVEQKYDRQRTDLVRSEREARLGLKTAMEDSSSADQNARVDQQLNQLVQAQRARADLLESEQKEFSGFLTPLQRAKYFSLREQLQKRMQQIQPTNPPPAGPPPPENPLPAD